MIPMHKIAISDSSDKVSTQCYMSSKCPPKPTNQRDRRQSYPVIEFQQPSLIELNYKAKAAPIKTMAANVEPESLTLLAAPVQPAGPVAAGLAIWLPAGGI